MNRYTRLYEKDFVTKVGIVDKVGPDYVVVEGTKLSDERRDVWPSDVKVGDKLALQGMSRGDGYSVDYYIARKV